MALTISKPLSIAYFNETDSHVGVLEIVETQHLPR